MRIGLAHPRDLHLYCLRLLGTLAALGLAGAPAAAQESGVVIDGIAAQVGSKIVLISDVHQLAAPIEERMREAGMADSEIHAMHADALERLVEASMIEDVVDRLELRATDAEVDAAIADIARDAGLSVKQLAQSVAAHGLPFDDYREKIRQEIERSKVISTMVRSRVRVEEYEVASLYAERFGDQPAGGREIHLRHILVAIGAARMRDARTACKLVQEARQRIESGQASFVEVAREISDANPQQGGDLGWIHLDDIAGWMKPAIDGLEAGQVSGVIETRFGCNLLEVVERKEFEAKSLDDVRPQLEDELFRQKTEEEYVKWVDRMREQTYIERKGIFAESSRLGAGGAPTW